MQGESEKKIHHLGALFGHVLGLSSSEADLGPSALVARLVRSSPTRVRREPRSTSRIRRKAVVSWISLRARPPVDIFGERKLKEGRGSHGFQALTGELSDDEEGAKPVREPGKRQNLWD